MEKRFLAWYGFEILRQNVKACDISLFTEKQREASRGILTLGI